MSVRVIWEGGMAETLRVQESPVWGAPGLTVRITDETSYESLTRRDAESLRDALTEYLEGR